MEFSEFIKAVAARGIWFNLGHWFVILATLILGILAYKRNPRNLNNRSFLFLNLSFAVWTFVMYTSDFLFLPRQVVLFIARLTFTFGFLLAAAFFSFCITFPEEKQSKPWYYLPAVLISVALALIATITNWIQKDFSVDKSGFIFYAHNGFLFPYSVMFLAFLAFGGLIILASKIKVLKGRKRTQLQYVFIGALLFIIYIFATDLIPQVIGVPDLQRYGALGVIFFVAFSYYAVIKHRLMDIRLVVVKSAVYSVLIALITAFYVIGIFYLKNYYQHLINPDAVFIIASFVFVFGFYPLRELLQKYADRIFSKGHYDFEEVIKKISNALTSSLVLDLLANELLEVFSSEMKIAKSAIVLKDGFQKGSFKFSEAEVNKLLKLANSHQIFVADELDDISTRKKLMQKLNIEVLVFIREGKQVLGFLAFSEKKSGDAYTAQDLKLLEIISPQISIALKNIEQQEQMIENIVEERQRINQDAHDHIYNRLSALAKKAEIAVHSPKEAPSILNLLKSDLNQTVVDLQRIVSGETAEETGTNQTIKDELQKICQDFINHSDIKLRFDFDNRLIEKLKPQYYWHLQCILEECLNNTQKHSQATQAQVFIKANNGSLIMQVEDDGIGIRKVRSAKSEVESESQGLKGMHERSAKMNSKLKISSNGKGTKVELRVPVGT